MRILTNRDRRTAVPFQRLAPINDSVALRFGAQLHGLDYGVSQFDDTTLNLIAGPRFQIGRWQITPSATGYCRWYGARFYSEGAGGSVEADIQAAPTLWLTSVVTAQALTYAPPAGQGGPFASASFGATHTLSPISTVTAALTLGRLDAHTSAYAYDTLQVNAGYSRELSKGFTASLQAGYAILNFDAALPAFGVARQDRQFTASVSLLNRALEFRGFTPRIAYGFTYNASNIPLFAYDRSRIELGAKRAF